MGSRSLVALLCGSLLALPAVAADPAKDTDGGKLPPGQYTGKLTSTPGSDGAFTVKVEVDQQQLNTGQVNAVNSEVRDAQIDQERIDKLQLEMARTKDPKKYLDLQ